MSDAADTKDPAQPADVQPPPEQTISVTRAMAMLDTAAAQRNQAADQVVSAAGELAELRLALQKEQEKSARLAEEVAKLKADTKAE